MQNYWVRIILALLITVGAAYYQRATGPTYSVSGNVDFQGSKVEYELLRSHGGEGDQPVEVTTQDKMIEGVVFFRHYNSDETWTGMKMQREENRLLASLPHQPPAGKIEYFVLLKKNDSELSVPAQRMVVTRFKGAIPWWILAPHILFMFTAMFLSTLTGLEALTGGGRLKKLTIQTVAVFFIGGMILGPIVQKFAFGEFWTGIPWGFDLTDNKTLIALVGWLIALWAVIKQKQARTWATIAAVFLLLVYTIPHSAMGSELNYKTGKIETSK